MNDIMVKDFFKYVYYTDNPLLVSILPTEGYEIPLDWKFYDLYKSNIRVFDERFYTMFSSFRYFKELDDFIVESYGDSANPVYVQLDVFQKSVYSFLLSNSKRYNELFRTYEVQDSEYMLLDNYNVTETTTRSRDESVTTESSATTGAQTDTVETKVAPFDSETYHNERQTNDNIGSRNDTGSSNSATNESENQTITKKGNIGVQTGSDMLTKHNDFWRSYEFFDVIFKDIASELLLV